jgi:predicted nucleic acid-binding protein
VIVVRDTSAIISRAFKPVLDDLIAKARFWISNPLYQATLRAAGE